MSSFTEFEKLFLNGQDVIVPPKNVISKSDLIPILESFHPHRLPELVYGTMILSSVYRGKRKGESYDYTLKEDGTVTIAIASTHGNIPLELLREFLDAFRDGIEDGEELFGYANEDLISIQFGKTGRPGQTRDILETAEALRAHQIIKIRGVPHEFVSRVFYIALRDIGLVRVMSFNSDQVDLEIDEYNHGGARLRRRYQYDENKLRRSDKDWRSAKMWFGDRSVIANGEKPPTVIMDHIMSFVGTPLPSDHPALLKGSPVPTTYRDDWQTAATRLGGKQVQRESGGRKHSRRARTRVSK